MHPSTRFRLEGFLLPEQSGAWRGLKEESSETSDRLMSDFEVIETARGGTIKAWVKGVPVEPKAREQLENVAGLPFVHSHLAVMPDVPFGRGATVGSVIPTKGAIIPAAVGVDIGCGMGQSERRA